MPERGFQQSLPPTAFLLLSLWLLFGPQLAQASESKLCKYHFQNKQYERSAQCFTELAQNIERKTPTLKIDDRIQVGSYLRNSSLAWRRAAKREKSPLRSLYLYEKALLQIQKILRKKYYENDSQKRLAQFIEERLLRTIGYTQVTIIAETEQAQIEVSGGYRFTTRKQTGIQFKLELRAGTYTVIVKTPGSPPQSRLVTITRAQQPVLLNFVSRKGMKNRPELVRQPARPLSASFRIAAITTASLGAAALLTGGLLIGIAFATKGEADKNGKEFQALLQQNPSSVNRENTLMVRDGIQAANTQMAAGIVVGSVGFAAGVAGVVMYATYIKSKAKANPAPPVSNSKKSRSVHCNLFP